jgi:hypothetical protein
MESFWKERKYIDMWSVSHFLFGASLAVFSVYWQVNFWVSVFCSAVIFIIWEFVEYTTHVGETTYNQMADIIVAMVGFFVFYILRNPLATSLLIFIFFILETGGYLSKIQGAHTSGEKKLNTIFMMSSWAYTVFYVFFILFH